MSTPIFKGTPDISLGLQVDPMLKKDHHRYGGEKGAVYQDKGKDSNKTLKMAMYLSIISIIMTVMTLVLALLTIEKDSRLPAAHQIAEEERGPIVCIDCIKLVYDVSNDIGSDPLLRQLPRKMEGDLEMCCAYNSNQMSALVQAVMRGGDSPHVPLATYNVSSFMFSPVSAHKRIFQENPHNISRDFGKMEFPSSPVMGYFNTSDDYGLEHHRGVDILSTGLRVRHGGLYYIYSSIHFRPQSIYSCSTFKFKTFIHRVVRVSSRQQSGSQSILKTTHTCCDACVHHQESRFTAGLFLLQPGDVIQVKVSSYRLVHFEPTTSFLGLAMLGTAQSK